MPWNSSKSDIYPNHNTFLALRAFLVRIAREYAAISRGWIGKWPQEVFAYDSGKIKRVKIEDFYPFDFAVIKGVTFENWAFPPKYSPHKYVGSIQSDDGGKVKVEVLGGLTLTSSPAGEYGVYIYCNDRLIAKELKSHDVGFLTGLVGQPHPSISLVRVIV